MACARAASWPQHAGAALRCSGFAIRPQAKTSAQQVRLLDELASFNEATFILKFAL
jgi:hypothetical protein